MKAHVLLSPHNVDELYFTGKNTVVIDVLRATSVIITALSNRAKEIIPVNSIEFAMKVSGNAFGGQTILAGERNTKKIDGFTLGNSPLEFTKENIEGKSIILFTTNGSKAIVKAKFSANLFLCAFNNLNAVASHLAEMNEDFEILCAGSNGMFCIEDTVCAGKLVRKIQKLKSDIILTDAAKASVELNKSFGKNVEELLYNCEHGKKLIDNGFEEDINYCAQIDNLDGCAVFNSGSIKLLKTN